MKPFIPVREVWDGNERGAASCPDPAKNTNFFSAPSSEDRLNSFKAAVIAGFPQEKLKYAHYLGPLLFHVIVLFVVFQQTVPLFDWAIASLRTPPSWYSVALWQMTAMVWFNLFVVIYLSFVSFGVIFAGTCVYSIVALALKRPEWICFDPNEPAEANAIQAFKQIFPEFDLAHPLIAQKNLSTQDLWEYAQILAVVNRS